ncbi:toprim domain-containing protein [Bradyrhizobium sp. AZCC 2289]|uniref:toprim domain-containing protein n=1 Tax=Bradyrhizobium sp. AZCC 2289 TaxID=3117026 RepID=UPI003FA5A67A
MVEAIARDGAVLLSLALQHGAELDNIRSAITRDEQGAPSSIVGAVVDQLSGEKPMMLGTVSGAAMKLQQIDGRKLNIAEGLETALAVIAMDRRPAWALGSTALMQTFPILAEIDKLIIWADHDRLKLIGGKLQRPGAKAALSCKSRWLAAGKQALAYEPIAEGDDAADEWSKRCGRL